MIIFIIKENEMTDTRRADYEQRQFDLGWRLVTARLDPDSVARLDKAARKLGNRAEAIKAAIKLLEFYDYKG